MMPDSIRYSEEVAAEICDRLVNGESIRSITRDPRMPCWTAVYKWIKGRPDFAERYNQARIDAADTFADQLLEIADDTSGDPIRDRLRLDARKWIAARMKPWVYGERMNLNATHTVRVAKDLTDDELARIAAGGSLGTPEAPPSTTDG